MQKRNIQIFLILAGVALCLLVAIQIRWISQARELNREQFGHRVWMAMNKTVSEYSQFCSGEQQPKTCCRQKGAYHNDSTEKERNLGRLDSILTLQLLNCQVDQPYSLEVISGSESSFHNNGCYCMRFHNTVNHEQEMLNVSFEKKQTGLMDRMGVMFVCSIILIVVLSLFFGMALYSLYREKQIQGRTTDLINNITHEFKTPMASIALASGMLARSGEKKLWQRVKHYATVIRAENERLRKQVEQLLKLSCLERGELPLSFQQVDMHILVHEALDSFALRIENRKADVTLKLSAQNILVNGDREFLLHVLMNLLDNAMKYSEGKPNISIVTNNLKQMMVIDVMDQGIGMSREEQRHVFDRYYRGHSGDVHDVKGFGIGLSYARMILEAHGGKMEVRSRKGSGSIFTIYIPYLVV